MAMRRRARATRWVDAGITVLACVLVALSTAPIGAGTSVPARQLAQGQTGAAEPTPQAGGPETSNGSGPGITVSTLILWNNTAVGGNYLGRFNGVVAASIALDAQDHRLFVADEGSGNSSYTDELIVVNTSDLSVTGGIPVGEQPDAVFFDSFTDQVFVANQGSDNVTVIDASSGLVVYSLPVGLDPNSFALDPMSDLLFVANGASGNVSVINTITGRLWGSVSVGENPDSLLFDPTTGYVYCVGEMDAHLNSINGSDPNGSGPVGPDGIGGSAMTLDPTTNQVWIANPDGGSVTLYDPVTNTVVGNLNETYEPVAIDYDPGNAYVYVASGLGSSWGNLSAVNATSRGAVGTVTVGDQPTDIAIDAPNDTIYITNGPVGTVSIVSTNSSINYLTSVAASPLDSALLATTAEAVSTTVTCNSGPCPGSVAYGWSTSNNLGSLNRSNGSGVRFTAGSSVGSTALTVVASLDGISVSSTAHVSITSPLVGVTVNPTYVSLATGSSAVVGASANCSGSPCPSSTTYSWSALGSLGTLNTTGGPSVRFTAGATVGATELTVTAKLFGASVSASSSVDVTTSRFTANISQSVASGPAPLTVWFNASTGGGPGPFAYSWNFGDGDSGTGAVVSHTYTAVGEYSVSLITHDSSNDSFELTAAVQVYAALPAGGSGGSGSVGGGPLYVSISGDPVTGPAPLDAHLSATVHGGVSPYTFDWNFGDGSTNASGAQVNHTYSAMGDYAATVLVEDHVGDQVETGTFLDVGNASGTARPLAVYVTILALQGTAPFLAEFTPAAVGGFGAYTLTWKFGDGSANYTTTGLAPISHTYASNGRYFPELIVTDSVGQSVSWSSAVLGGPVSVNGPKAPPGTPISGQLWLWIDGLLAVAVVAGAGVGIVVQSRRSEFSSPLPVRPGYEAYRDTGRSGSAPQRGSPVSAPLKDEDDPESDML
jgi:YVTN family beta-propeller protein